MDEELEDLKFYLYGVGLDPEDVELMNENDIRTLVTSLKSDADNRSALNHTTTATASSSIGVDTSKSRETGRSDRITSTGAGTGQSTSSRKEHVAIPTKRSASHSEPMDLTGPDLDLPQVHARKLIVHMIRF